MTDYSYIAYGPLVYDPRVGKKVFSSNPALVLLDMVLDGRILTDWTLSDEFYSRIAALADFCDELTSV